MSFFSCKQFLGNVLACELRDCIKWFVWFYFLLTCQCFLYPFKVRLVFFQLVISVVFAPRPVSMECHSGTAALITRAVSLQVQQGHHCLMQYKVTCSCGTVGCILKLRCFNAVWVQIHACRLTTLSGVFIAVSSRPPRRSVDHTLE
jgi:hypothetical protein